jgi:type IV pilus assembly protein PilB
MIITDELRDMIMRNEPTDEMRKVAQRNGMVSLRDAGMNFMHEGTTTAEEVARETIVDG